MFKPGDLVVIERPEHGRREFFAICNDKYIDVNNGTIALYLEKHTVFSKWSNILWGDKIVLIEKSYLTPLKPKKT